MLVDTDVLIWHLRGYPRATRRLDEFSALTLSAVSYLELLQGTNGVRSLISPPQSPQRGRNGVRSLISPPQSPQSGSSG